MSFQGVYRAIVADNNDPEGLFRLRLRIPSLTGQSVTTWAWPMARFDVVEIPPVGTGVFAMFEGGDVSFPLWTGSFANPNPPQVVNEYVRKDGTIPFTQPQFGVTPTAALHLATKGYVDIAASQYQLSSARGEADGYASLDASTKVPVAQLPTGDTGTTLSLGNHTHLYSRNRIINGDFSVNQRAFTSTTATGYGFDRWRFGTVGGTCTHSAQTPALGDLPESAKSFARVVTSGQSAAADLSYLTQRIESVRTLSGKTITISLLAKAASGTPKVAVELSQVFGTGGSPSTQVDTYAGQITLSTTWTRYNVTVTLPSVTGKTLGTAGDDFLALALWTSAGSTFSARTGSLGIQNATIDLWGVQVEEGSVATAFEVESYGDNLRRCQRYYWRTPSGGAYRRFGSGVAGGTTAAYVAIAMPVPMRAVPASLGSSAASGFALWDGLSNITASAIAADTLDTLCCNLLVSATTVQYRPYQLTANNNTAAYLEFSAEL